MVVVPSLDRPLDRRLDRLKAFAYVQAEKAPLYRAVMGVFIDAKARFALHLRPRDVAAALKKAVPDGIFQGEGDTESSVETALVQLVEWGNLESHPDTAEVATVEEFYRPRFLFQLSVEGEAAERALAVFHEAIERPGELQTVALADIRELLTDLLQLAGEREVDAGKVHRTLLALTARFDELTARAQSFMGSLQRTIDLQGVDLEAFLSYKDTLIDYLERFIGELVLTTSEIVDLLARLEAVNPDRLLLLAARRDLADVLSPSQELHEVALGGWRSRWWGLRSWFVGDAEGSQAEVLRARARAAIPALLNAVVSIHDRRVRRSDRFTDLRTLARWFAETDSDFDAHRLWRAAFGLSSARHLRIDAATLELYDETPIAAGTSWLEAPPLVLTPRLRRTGRYRRRGRTASVIDRREEKAALARWAAAEAAQIAAARRRLAGGPQLLSEIGHLERDAFHLFLDLLGDALSRRPQADQPVETTSADGSLHILLEPVVSAGVVTLETSDGLFSGPEHRITIRDLLPQVPGIDPAVVEVGSLP